VLNSSEKAYCLALQALRDRKYGLAVEYFDRAAPYFKENKEFNLYRETVKLLVAVKEELVSTDDKLLIEETFSDG
jgi:hypothetical protein